MIKLLKIISIFWLTFSLFSCIPYKDTIYLNKNRDKVDNIQVNQDANSTYRIQVNDVLHIHIKASDKKYIEIFSKTENQNNQPSEQSLYFDGYMVDNYGDIKMPVLGNIKVIGNTLDEIAKNIEERLLKEYLYKETNLFVSVKLAGLKYTMHGEIGNPGTKSVYTDKLSIIEAIANSGEIKDSGDKRQVVITRKVAGGFESETLDLTDANVINSKFYYLKPNDVVYVKPNKLKSLGLGNNGLQTVTTIASLFSVVVTTYLLTKNL